MAVTNSAQTGSPSVLESRNPATGEVLGTVPVHSDEDVRARVERARQAARQWGALGFSERRAALDSFRRALAARADDLADLIHRENGKPRLDALMEILLALTHLAHASARAEKVLAPQRVSAGMLANFRAVVHYLPLGVIGVIGPWNYPLFTPIGSIGSALAAGNAVVFKPSELTPLVGAMLASIAASSLGHPDLVQVVTGYGPTGAALVRAGVDKISFTGSTATGRKIMAAAAESLTPVLLELGGKDPMIVAADADIDEAAEAAVFGALTNAGQTCISIERVYVAAPIYDRFVERVVDLARNVRVGKDSSATDSADIGPMTRPEQVDAVREHIRDAVEKGARALVGGPDAVNGSFVSPTVLVDVTDDMRVMREETFGPVLPIVRVADADEALRRSNALGYGLGSAIFGKQGVRELASQLRAGMTSINSVLAFAGVPFLPFGGVGESGFGRIHGDDGLREFVRPHSVAEARFGLPKSFDLMSFRQPEGAYERLRMVIEQVYGGGAVDKAGALLRKLRPWR
jgi:acyl-CoA reductase-like NAD-dependent aldehyde dehydrogenase